MLYWRESNPEPEDSKPHVLRARETHSHAGNQVSFTSSPGLGGKFFWNMTRRSDVATSLGAQDILRGTSKVLIRSR